VIDLPEAVVKFLKRPNPAVIAFIRPDGFPMSVATWYDWENGLILVNMHESRSRLRWLRANPKASLTALGGGGVPSKQGGEVPPQQGGASGAGSARPDALRGEVPPQQGGASGAGSARPDALRGDVPPQTDDWYRHVSLYGSVVRFADDTKLADIDRLCLRYTGKAFSNRRAKRVSAWIEPHGWHGWDDEGEVASTSVRT
jgi:Pyridoxamine 5'-phosphate oxidase